MPSSGHGWGAGRAPPWGSQRHPKVTPGKDPNVHPTKHPNFAAQAPNWGAGFGVPSGVGYHPISARPVGWRVGWPIWPAGASLRRSQVGGPVGVWLLDRPPSRTTVAGVGRRHETLPAARASTSRRQRPRAPSDSSPPSVSRAGENLGDDVGEPAGELPGVDRVGVQRQARSRAPPNSTRVRVTAVCRTPQCVPHVRQAQFAAEALVAVGLLDRPGARERSADFHSP